MMKQISVVLYVLCVAVLILGCSQIAKCKIERPSSPEKGVGVPMVAVGDAECFESPMDSVPSGKTLVKGGQVVATESVASRYAVWVDGSQWCGWVDAAGLKPQSSAGTRGFSLLVVPLLAAAGKYVVSEVSEWVTKKGKEAASKALCGAVTVLREEGDRVLVQTSNGAKAWAKKNAVSAVSSVVPATSDELFTDLLEGGNAADNPTGLTVEVRAVRPDGGIILAGETLRLNEEYDLEVRCSTDCFVRITAQTPGQDALCQYHPNHFSGYGQSIHLKGGKWEKGILLPPGTHFAVREPIANKDIIRVEANAHRPYQYLPGGDKGEGCSSLSAVKDGALTGCTRGGGFSNAASCATRGGGFSSNKSVQPGAEAVAKLEILTSI